MYDESQLRKAYFACCKKLGMATDARHDFNHAMTGKRSATRFTLPEWRAVVARLQADCGRKDVQPGQPHLKAGKRRRRRLPAELTTCATDEQQAFIVDLAGRISWDHEDGLERLIRARVLIRATTQETQWQGSLETLDRQEASKAIRILSGMARAKTRRRRRHAV